ncbi:MAG: hypothetical protein WBB01_19965 [Phormidesmis sp.]
MTASQVSIGGTVSVVNAKQLGIWLIFPDRPGITRSDFNYGELYKLCPITRGRYMAGSIPNCSARFFPEEGHISLYVNHYEEILATLIDL